MNFESDFSSECDTHSIHSETSSFDGFTKEYLCKGDTESCISESSLESISSLSEHDISDSDNEGIPCTKKACTVSEIEYDESIYIHQQDTHSLPWNGFKIVGDNNY